MPELTEADIRAIHENNKLASNVAVEIAKVKDGVQANNKRISDVAALLLGVNGNTGLAKRVENYMLDSDKRIRRLEIIVFSIGVVTLSGGGIFGIVKLLT